MNVLLRVYKKADSYVASPPFFEYELAKEILCDKSQVLTVWAQWLAYVHAMPPEERTQHITDFYTVNDIPPYVYIYSVLISQTGTSAPSMDREWESNLPDGASPTFSYDDVGVFHLTFTLPEYPDPDTRSRLYLELPLVIRTASSPVLWCEVMAGTFSENTVVFDIYSYSWDGILIRWIAANNVIKYQTLTVEIFGPSP
jgi:hypothetical protein